MRRVNESQDDTSLGENDGKEEAAIRYKNFSILRDFGRIAASSFPHFPLFPCHPEFFHKTTLDFITEALFVEE
jgi:hypothetical protein